MGSMSTDRPQAEAPAPTPAPEQPATVQFGEEGPARSAPAWLTGVRDDRRLPPILAGLAALALAVSLLSEWQVTSLDEGLFTDDGTGVVPLDSGVGDIGGWGAAYLAGVVVQVIAATLLLFGPRPGRGYARPAVLSTGGVLAVLLVTLAGVLGERTFAVPMAFILNQEDQVEVVRGRGVWCALAGVLILALAAWLTRVPAVSEPAEESPWRRTAEQPAPEEEQAAPIDLTVGPAVPFTPQRADLDRSGDPDWRRPGR